MGLFDCWNELLKNQPAWLEVPIDKELYSQAEGVIRELGSTPEDAVRLLLQQLAANADSIKDQLSQGGNAQALLQGVIAETNEEIAPGSTLQDRDTAMRDSIDAPAHSNLVELKERVFSVSALRKHQSSVFDYIEAPGHVAIITRRGVRECAMMSISTYRSLIDYADSLAKLCSQYLDKER